MIREPIAVKDTYADAYAPIQPQEATPSIAPSSEQNEPVDIAAGLKSLQDREAKSNFAQNIPPASRSANVGPAKTQFRATGQAPTNPISWGDAVTEGISNIPKSAGELGQGIYNTFRHPIDSAGNIANLAAGLGEQGLTKFGVADFSKDKDAQSHMKMASTLEDIYKQRYGSVEGFKQAIAKDPIGVMMDLSTVLTGGSSALGKVATTGSTLSKAAQVAGKVSGYTDPVNIALKSATAIPKFAVGAARKAAEITSGVSSEQQKLATFAGTLSEKDPRRIAFENFYKKDPNPHSLLDTVQSAAEQKAKSESLAFQNKLGTLGSNPIDLSAARNTVEESYKKQKSMGAHWPEDFDQAHQKIMDMFDEVQNDPSRVGLDSVNEFKKQLWAHKKTFPQGGKGQDHFNTAYNEVKNALANPSVGGNPEYADLMEQWRRALDEINTAKNSVGIGGNSKDALRTLTKSLRTIKTASGKSVIDGLSQYEPTIPYMLAGAAGNPANTTISRDIIDGMMVAGLHSIGAGPASLLPLAGASPKVVSGTNFLSGKLTKPIVYPARAISKMAEPLKPYAKPFGAVGTRANDMAQPDESQPATSTDEGGTFSRMLRQESGDRQLDKNGEPITSSAGAIGAAQVMPGTGPEAAQLAGLPWDEDKFRHDADYNRKLGEAYFNHQKDVFGDERHAVAAYNAGPERVKKALADAKTSGKDFLEHLPPETQNYVRKVLSHAAGGRINRASGGRLDGIEPLVQRLMSKYMQAKKATDKTTEPLLNEPDEHIVHALKVAQDAI